MPLAVFAAEEYGVALFVATPVWNAAAATYAFHRPFASSIGSSLAVAELTVMVGSLALLLFALEARCASPWRCPWRLWAA